MTALPNGSAIYPDPTAACAAQHAAYGGPGQFYGAKLSGTRSDVAGCSWEYTFGYSHAAIVWYVCPPGKYMGTFGGCWPENMAASQCPVTDHPINILTGAKLFFDTDFATADGTISFDRSYSSRPYGGLNNYAVNTPNFSLGNWSAFFDVQLQLAEHWDYYQIATVLYPNGISQRFRKQSDGKMTPYSDSDQPLASMDGKLTFLGTWPANSYDLTRSVSSWQLIDPDNNIWTLQTRNDNSEAALRVAKPISMRRPDGSVLTFTYDADQMLSSIADQNGKVIQITWNRGKFLTNLNAVALRPLSISKVSLPGGYSLNYKYQDAGGVVSTTKPIRLSRVEYVDNAGIVRDATNYQYTNPAFPSFVTAISDRNGIVRWKVTYDANGYATRSEGPNGEMADSIAYAPIGDTFTRTQTNALGRKTVYTFTRQASSARLKSVEGMATTNCPYANAGNTYDPNGHLATSADEEGRITSYTRDPLARPVSIIEASGTGSARTTLFTWHPQLNLPTQVSVSGLNDLYAYDGLGRLTTLTKIDTTTQTVPYTTKGQQRAWSYSYGTTAGAVGKVTAINGPLPGTGGTQTFRYNANGYLAAQVDEVGKITTVTAWDWRGAPLTVVDPNGVTTALTYDIRGRILTATVNPGSAQSRYAFTYDAVGNVTQVALPTGGSLQYSYDTASRLTKIQNEKGEAVSFTLNAAGQPTLMNVKTAAGVVTEQQSFNYDELGRLIRTIGAASVTPTRFTYDKVSNPKSMTDGRGKTSSNTFDALNRLVAETNPDQQSVKSTYNPNDQLTNFTDGRNLATRFIRNGFGEVIQEISPDRGTMTYTRDNAGRVIRYVDGDGQVTQMTYDNAGRLLTKTFANAASENMAFTYDDVGGGNKGVTRLTKVTEASGSTALSYDAFGNVVKVTKVIQGKTYTRMIAYDAAGNILQQQLPSGRRINFIRNASGQVTTITSLPRTGAATSIVVSSVNYQPFGPIKSMVFGNSLPLTQTYNINGWITRTQLGTGASVKLDLGYRYSDDGRLAGIDDFAATGRSVQIAVTNAGRLASATGAWGTETFGYDAAGNRVTQKLVVGQKASADNQIVATTSNRLIKTTDASGATKRTFTYKAGGDLATDTAGGVSYRYIYNARKRLSQIMFGPVTVGEYGYDYNEHRVWRKTYGLAPATTHYVYDQEGHLLAEHNGVTGAVIREYAWLDNTLVSVFDNSSAAPQTYYVHAGRLNEPQVMTDYRGVKVWDANMSPFGSARIFVSGNPALDLRLPGQWHQAEAGALGLSQNWHRDYDTSLGRYIEADPLGIEGGSNLYAYVDGQPYHLSDPKGLTAQCPVSPPKNLPGWRNYGKGASVFFHCGYDAYLEDRIPTTDDPIAECVYDECGQLVDGRHNYSGCRGTDNQYTDWYSHTFIDAGGIYNKGRTAVGESIRKQWNEIWE